MKLNEAKKILKNAGYIVENTNTISFEQEAENIVYSYGTDEYGLDVDHIVKIMEDASEIKDVGEQGLFIHKQFKEITGLSMWDIEGNKELEAALFDICSAVYKNSRQGKSDDKLGEAKEILKKNSYQLKEKTIEVPTNKVYIVIMDNGENDDDYAVFRDIIKAQKWGDNNCKYDYTVKISKMF